MTSYNSLLELSERWIKHAEKLKADGLSSNPRKARNTIVSSFAAAEAYENAAKELKAALEPVLVYKE